MAGNINDLIIADNDYEMSRTISLGFSAAADRIVGRWDKYIGILQAILDEEIIMGMQTAKITSMIARAHELKPGAVGVIAYSKSLSLAIAGNESMTMSMNSYIASVDMADNILY